MRNAIVLILTVSGILRLFFFIKVSIPSTWDNGFCMALFIIPLWMHCLAISLLICYYATTVYLDMGQETPFIICAAFNLVALIFDVTIAASFASASGSSEEELLRLIFCIFSTVEDVVLAILLVYFGSLFHKMAVDGQGHGGNVLATWNKRSLSLFETLNWILTATMLFRAALSVVFYLEPALNGTVQYNGIHPVTAPVVVVFFGVAELVPSLCIFYMLFKLDVSSHNSARGDYKYKRFRFARDGGDGDGDGAVDGDSYIDERLLSFEDASIRVVIAKKEDEEEAEKADNAEQSERKKLATRPSPIRDVPQRAEAEAVTSAAKASQDNNATPEDSRSLFHSNFSPDEAYLVDDLFARESGSGIRATESSTDSTSLGPGRESGSSTISLPTGRNRAHSYLRRTPSPGSLHHTHTSAMGVKINRQASPSGGIYSYSESPNMSTFAEISEEAASEGAAARRDEREKYSEFVSPRDILLHHGHNKNKKKHHRHDK